MDEKKYEQKLKLVLSKCNVGFMQPLDKEELYKFFMEHLDSYERVNISERVLRENYPELYKELREWYAGFLECVLLHKGIMP